MVVQAEQLQAIDELLARYGYSRIGLPRPVHEGVLNENFRVETSAGPRFVRLHRPATTAASLGLEHEALRWAGERGIPVNPPLAARNGATFHTIGGRLWAVSEAGARHFYDRPFLGLYIPFYPLVFALDPAKLK